jgi:hypothetical protein
MFLEGICIGGGAMVFALIALITLNSDPILI